MAIPFSLSTLFTLLKALAILAAGTLVMSPAMGGSWYGDDDLYINNNPLLQDPNRLWKAWFEPGSFIEYYPMEQTVQWLQWKLWGSISAHPYLQTNLVLHLTSTLLLWHLFSKLGLKLAWLGGLIFAIHPALVDTIANACELKNTLSLPPFLLAMVFYLDFERTRQPRFYLLALGLFLTAMLCKITMAFFPVIILLYAWWKRERITKVDLIASAPFFVISLVLGLTTVHAGAVYATGTGYHSPGPIHLGGFWNRIALAGLSLTFYFGHSFFPLHLMPYYPMWQLEPLKPWLFAPWLAILTAFAYCWMNRHGWGRPALFALGFFVLAMTPFLGLNQVSYMCLLWVQDHLLYLPIIGLIGLTVAGMEHGSRLLAPKLLPAGFALLVLGLGLLGFQAYSYASLFDDQDQLWRYNLEYNPNSWFLRNCVGMTLIQHGDLDEGIAQLSESIRLNPDFSTPYMVEGLALNKRGKVAESVDILEEALRKFPWNHQINFELADVMAESKHYPEAIEQFKLYLQDQPDSIQAIKELGGALYLENRFAEALDQFEAASRLVPDDDSIKELIKATREEMQKNAPKK